MTVHNILVALDGSDASESALGAAVSMQKAFGCHVTAFVTVNDVLQTHLVDNDWIPAELQTTLTQAKIETMDAIEASFAKATEEAPDSKTHVIERLGANDTTVAESARFFDIALIGIATERSRRKSLHPDRIALLSGRPVLAFPSRVDVSSTARRAMVAWDGSRAAARSLSSAIRLLETKEKVTVVTVGDTPEAQQSPSGLDPQTLLERHGITSEWINVPKARGGIAQTLLSQVDELDVELLIMGAFEHSKFREDLFGGVTHDVMAMTQVPVFLAH